MEVLKMSNDKQTGACHQCMCNGGKVEDCHHIFHCSLNSPDCASYKQIPGQCCPECGTLLRHPAIVKKLTHSDRPFFGLVGPGEGRIPLVDCHGNVILID